MIPLVTGATGFAGGHLVEHLLGHEPRVAAWGHAGGRELPAATDDRVSWSAVDITDSGAVTRALDRLRPSAIYHCAGVADVHGTWAVSTRALRSVQKRGGLDAFLLGSPDSALPPEALRLKHQVKKARS